MYSTLAYLYYRSDKYLWETTGIKQALKMQSVIWKLQTTVSLTQIVTLNLCTVEVQEVL